MLYMANKASIMLLGEQKTCILNTLLDHKARSAVTDFRVPTSAWLNLIERCTGRDTSRGAARTRRSCLRMNELVTRQELSVDRGLL